MNRIILILFLALSFFGCDKQCPPEEVQDNHVMYVQWTGEPEVDGCGWLLIEQGTFYHPVNLPEEFQQDQLEVVVKYSRIEPDFYCGRSSVPKVSIRISEINSQPQSIRILKEHEWDKVSMDMFVMDTAYVEGDSLHLIVSYSGGCANHQFDLWKLPGNEVNPSRVEVLLSHISNGDLCEAWLTNKLSYGLVPLRERGKHAVTFLLRGPPVMSAYFGEYIYRY